MLQKVSQRLKIEFGKFTAVGAVNFFLTFAIFTIMLNFFSVGYLLSLAAAWIFSIAFSFSLNYSWVFRSENKVEIKSSFVRFFLASALSIAMNMLMLKYLVEFVNIEPLYAQMLLTPFVIIFNFITAKFWSF